MGVGSQAQSQRHAKPKPGRAGRVLVVDDEPNILMAFERLLRQSGHTVRTALSGEEALAGFEGGRFDVVVCDIRLPTMDGLELLRGIRERDPDVPVVLVTGGPSLESAMQAMRFGALRYLVKPVDPDELRSVIAEAIGLNEIAVAKRRALELMGARDRFLGDRASLEIAFERALTSVQLHFQPIVRWSSRSVVAYEALLRVPGEETLDRPDALIDAAERLGWIHRMSRKVREYAARSLPARPDGSQIFVNLHANDLSDPTLFEAIDPLADCADQVVFEITERQSLTEIEGIHTNVARLKQRGFRVALDDFGAGHAGLTSFAILEPDIIKLDMGLVRDVDVGSTKRKLVESMVTACRDLEVEVIAEGVERTGELHTLLELGCDLFQGFLFGRPASPFPAPHWP